MSILNCNNIHNLYHFKKNQSVGTELRITIFWKQLFHNNIILDQSPEFRL